MAPSTRRVAVALAALLVATYCAAPIFGASTVAVEVEKPADEQKAPGASQPSQPAAGDSSCGCSACQAKQRPRVALDNLVQWPRPSLFSDLDDLLFDRPFRAPAWLDIPRRLDTVFGGEGGASVTNVGIRTLDSDEDKTVLGVRLPGVPRENLKVSVDAEGLLTVEGGYSERTPEAAKPGEEKAAEGRHEFQFFAQQQLPFGVDAARVEADYKDGLLRVTVPKPRKNHVTPVSIA